MLSGKVNGELPFDIREPRSARVVLPVMWFVANHVLTMRTPLGRKARPHVRSHGGPLLRVKRAHLLAAGVERTDARVAGVRDGQPVLDDGRVLDVANVIWCTGFGKDVSWIDVPVTGADGWPEQTRGVVESSPGLYFVGLPFLRLVRLDAGRRRRPRREAGGRARSPARERAATASRAPRRRGSPRSGCGRRASA